MEKLKELLSLCKHSVTVDVNQHRDYYETIEEYIEPDDIKNIALDVLQVMIETNTMVRISAYKETAISFFLVYHHDLEEALDQVLKEVKAKPPWN